MYICICISPCATLMIREAAWVSSLSTCVSNLAPSSYLIQNWKYFIRFLNLMNKISNGIYLFQLHIDKSTFSCHICQWVLIRHHSILLPESADELANNAERKDELVNLLLIHNMCMFNCNIILLNIIHISWIYCKKITYFKMKINQV
jgi:hypothetical protein